MIPRQVSSPVGCGGLAPVLAHVEDLRVEAAPAQVPGMT